MNWEALGVGCMFLAFGGFAFVIRKVAIRDRAREKALERGRPDPTEDDVDRAWGAVWSGFVISVIAAVACFAAAFTTESW